MKFKWWIQILLTLHVSWSMQTLVLNNTYKTYNCYDCFNIYSNSVYCSSTKNISSSFCCPYDTAKRSLACYTIPLLQQTCSDSFTSQANYEYLKYQTCLDSKHTCNGT